MQVIHTLILYYSYTVIPTLNTFYFIFFFQFFSKSLYISVCIYIHTYRALYLKCKGNNIKELQQNETDEKKRHRQIRINTNMEHKIREKKHTPL